MRHYARERMAFPFICSGAGFADCFDLEADAFFSAPCVPAPEDFLVDVALEAALVDVALEADDTCVEFPDFTFVLLFSPLGS
jgi:hypothetical protein